MNIDDKTLRKGFEAVKSVALWIIVLGGLWFVLDWLLAHEIAPGGPTRGDSTVAWVFKGTVAAALGILMPLLIVGAVRRSPMQEWMLPFWDEIRDAAGHLKRRLAEADEKPLTVAEGLMAVGLSIGCGLTLLAVLVFAGFLVLRM